MAENQVTFAETSKGSVSVIYEGYVYTRRSRRMVRSHGGDVAVVHFACSYVLGLARMHSHHVLSSSLKLPLTLQ